MPTPDVGTVLRRTLEDATAEFHAVFRFDAPDAPDPDPEEAMAVLLRYHWAHNAWRRYARRNPRLPRLRPLDAQAGRNGVLPGGLPPGLDRVQRAEELSLRLDRRTPLDPDPPGGGTP